MGDAKKRTELRESVAVAKAGLTNLLGHIPHWRRPLILTGS